MPSEERNYSPAALKLTLSMLVSEEALPGRLPLKTMKPSLTSFMLLSEFLVTFTLSVRAMTPSLVSLTS